MATDATSPANDSKPAVGLIGIGLVGTALAERLIAGGLRVVGFDVDDAKRGTLEQLGGLASPDAAGVFTVLVTIPVVVLGVWWESLNVWAQAAARNLL